MSEIHPTPDASSGALPTALHGGLPSVLPASAVPGVSVAVGSGVFVSREPQCSDGDSSGKSAGKESPGSTKPPEPIKPHEPPKLRMLHRIGDVRKSQNISVSVLAKRMNLEQERVREVEDPKVDMLLSELYRWRDALDVPVGELIVEPEDLPTNPIRNRGMLLRIMKTVRSILDNAHEKKIRLLAQTLADQLIELMPELEDVSSWPNVGQSREFKDYGQAVFRRFESGTSVKFEE